jgi:hypothetical protein
MGIKRVLNSRLAAVGAGAAVLAVLAGGVGYAAGEITSKDIQDNTIRSADVKDDSLKLKDLTDGAAKQLQGRDGVDGKDGVNGTNGVDGKDAFVDLKVAELGAPVAIENIGGPINTNNTDLGVGLDLAPGTYLVTVDGSFLSDVAAAEGAPAVYPQLSLWIDNTGDGEFQWQQGEGDISPNALMPTVADRHISVNGSTVIEITGDEPVHVGLLAFGYAADQSPARSGEIDVDRAVLTATPLPAA